MSIVRYEPFSWNQFQREIENMFNRSNEQAVGDSAITTSAWIPAVDIKEEINKFIIEADIPGVAPEEVDITIGNNVLTIKGERSSNNEIERDKYKRVERTHGSFYRRFSLPDTADLDNVSANGKNGVLLITIPKREVALDRKIEVKT